MPAEKWPSVTQNDEPSSPSQPKLRRFDVVEEAPPDDGGLNPSLQQSSPPLERKLQLKQEVEEQNDAVSEEDSDASDAGDAQGFAYVDLQTIRKEVQCPICLGIIKKTRTVMECLHRFCRECIDKSMRMGNNECPACRTHCASRRSLRDDPRYDAIIAALYPDIKKFEEEELAFCEEDETRNKQIQDSITEVLRKQSEVIGKKRPINKDTASPSTVRNYQTAPSRKRRRRRRKRRNASPDYQDSDDNDADDSDKQFDMYELDTESKQSKGKSRTSVGSSHSPSATSFENNEEEIKEVRGLSPGLIGTTEMLAWGKGGVRSNTRNSNVNGGTSKNARRIRLAKLVDFLRTLEDNDEEYVALQTSIQAENVKVLDMPDCNGSSVHHSIPHPSSSSENKLSQNVDPLEDSLHLLEREKTLSGAVASCISNGEQLHISKRKQCEALESVEMGMDIQRAAVYDRARDLATDY